MDEADEAAWKELAAIEFGNGYAESDSIYDCCEGEVEHPSSFPSGDGSRHIK